MELVIKCTGKSDYQKEEFNRTEYYEYSAIGDDLKECAEELINTIENWDDSDVVSVGSSDDNELYETILTIDTLILIENGVENDITEKHRSVFGKGVDLYSLVE